MTRPRRIALTLLIAALAGAGIFLAAPIILKRAPLLGIDREKSLAHFESTNTDALAFRALFPSAQTNSEYWNDRTGDPIWNATASSAAVEVNAVAPVVMNGNTAEAASDRSLLIHVMHIDQAASTPADTRIRAQRIYTLRELEALLADCTTEAERFARLSADH